MRVPAWRVRQVSLGVNAENAAAIALYERMGFEPFGREPCFMLVDGIPQDEVQMVCMLQPAALIRRPTMRPLPSRLARRRGA